MSGEQRRARRIPVDLPARYRSETVSLNGRAGDISQNGMFFHTVHLDRSLGSVVIEIDLPDAFGPGPLTLGGEVRWVESGPKRTGMGICFTRIPHPERRRLANYVIHRTCRPD